MTVHERVYLKCCKGQGFRSYMSVLIIKYSCNCITFASDLRTKALTCIIMSIFVFILSAFDYLLLLSFVEISDTMVVECQSILFLEYVWINKSSGL